MNTSAIRRSALAGSALVVIAGASLGYSYLKPTASQSAPIESVYMTTLDDEAATGDVYTVSSDNAQASFTIDEILRGAPFTVVGTTNQVAGQFVFDPSNPSAAQLGTIVINARTLTTDDSSRNRALGNQILGTDQYEYITFSPTTLSGLPSTVTAGEPFTFQATGDLTIKDVIRAATFDVTLVPTTDGQLQGSATTTIQYADWGVSIPSVPLVASVGNEVALQFDFAATPTA